MRRYVAEFKVVGEPQEQDVQAKETSEIIEKDTNMGVRNVGKALTVGVGVVATGSRLYSVYRSAENAIVGDSVAQRQFDNRMAYLNEGLTVFGTLGIAALVNPATLAAAGTATVISYGIRSFQVSQQNNVKQAHFAVERATNEQRQARLVRDITGIRV